MRRFLHIGVGCWVALSGCARKSIDIAGTPPALTKAQPVAERPVVAPKPAKIATEQAAKVTPEDPKIALDLVPYMAGVPGYVAFQNKRWGDAARLFKQWIRSHPTSPKRTKAMLLLHMSQLYSGDRKSAALGFDSLVGKMAPINDYVHLLAAEAWFRNKDDKKTLHHLDAIKTPNFAQAQRCRHLRVSALLRQRDYKAAVTAFSEAILATSKPVASLCLDGARAYAKMGNRKKAAEQWRYVLSKFPHTPSAQKAAQGLKSLPKKYRVLSKQEKLQRLQSLYDAQWHKNGISESVTIQKGARVGSETWCRASYLRAKILEKQKKYRAALTQYSAAVPVCSKTKQYVHLLYFGGKRQMKSGTNERALKWFGVLHKVAPEHRFIDDAMRWQAQVLRRMNRNKEADSLLADVIQGKGDMREDAAWDLVWHHLVQGDIKAAEKMAAKAVDAISREKKSYTNGRLRYWRGRTAEMLGQRVVAALAYARCIREYPLTYYGLLATQRLTGLDPKAAAEAVQAAKQSTPTTSILKANKVQLESEDMSRTLELLRLGLQSYARAELNKQAALSKDPVKRDWFRALLYDRIGDHTKSYRIARWRRPEYAQSYPQGNHLERWLISYPRPAPYQATVKEAAEAHGVHPALIWSVMRHESAFKPTVVSIANAVGLMQLIIPTAKSMARLEGLKGKVDRSRLKKPLTNIKLGTRYLGRLARRFDSHPALMASGYNAGPGAPMKWMRRRPGEALDLFVERIPYRETRRYTKSVVTSYLRYRYLYYGKEAPPLPFKLPDVQ